MTFAAHVLLMMALMQQQSGTSVPTWSSAPTCGIDYAAFRGVCYQPPSGECPTLILPEPTDVPAVEIEVEVAACFRTMEGCHRVTDAEGKAVPTNQYFSRPDWRTFRHYVMSCADKTRVLLTSEDGKKHCVKF